MQTFVPYADFAASAAVLDSKRLNKQLLEGRQIYKILAEDQYGVPWSNHPAVKMWRGFNIALYKYLDAVKDECDTRGIKTDINWEAIERIHRFDYGHGINLVMPPWWGDDRIHESHRNNLFVKDPIFYEQFENANRITCCDRCNYFWPVTGHQYKA
jgi:hypothetical protein